MTAPLDVYADSLEWLRQMYTILAEDLTERRAGQTPSYTVQDLKASLDGFARVGEQLKSTLDALSGEGGALAPIKVASPAKRAVSPAKRAASPVRVPAVSNLRDAQELFLSVAPKYEVVAFLVDNKVNQTADGKTITITALKGMGIDDLRTFFRNQTTAAHINLLNAATARIKQEQLASLRPDVQGHRSHLATIYLGGRAVRDGVDYVVTKVGMGGREITIQRPRPYPLTDEVETLTIRQGNLWQKKGEPTGRGTARAITFYPPRA